MARLSGLEPLTQSLKCTGKDMEHFHVSYASVQFDVVYDISRSPYQMLIGAIGHSWASTVLVEEKWEKLFGSMPSKDFFSLCDLLNLRPGKGTFTSAVFLKHIAGKAPIMCSKRLVSLDVLQRFRPVSKEGDNTIRNIFRGWNDHISDGFRARNFDKTERYFGKRVADYCRKHNISSIWTDDIHYRKREHLPKGFHFR